MPENALPSTAPPEAQATLSSLGSTIEDPTTSALKKWLDKLDTNAIRNSYDRRIWKALGWEVYERKALLLAAAKDLKANNIPDAIKLAATDIFVEKAQRTLTIRGKWLYIFGAATATLATTVLLYTAWHISNINALELLHVDDSSKSVSSGYLTIVILKSTTASALVASVVYLLIALSRALLHEATVLYSRRHSLRFGRLFVYLMSSEMTREDLELVFNWNAEFSTAFKDIKAENIAKTPVSKAMETAVEILKAVAELQKVSEEKNSKKVKENEDSDQD